MTNTTKLCPKPVKEWANNIENGTHLPVMVQEILGFLESTPALGLASPSVVVDGTLGLGGHAYAILSTFPNIDVLLGTDVDSEALSRAKDRLSVFNDRVRLLKASYTQIPEMLEAEDLPKACFILLDLGLSSYQLEASGRGFSFGRDDPLDMRMDLSLSVTASDMVNNLPEKQLADLIRSYGEERWAKKIARLLVNVRKEQEIISSKQLADLVFRAIPRRYHPRRIHPATKTFQALRIAVNQELDRVKEALDRLPDCLEDGGRFAIISFHSLEDRLVKHSFRNDTRLKVLTKKPIRATEVEIRDNRRSRSAKLRVAEKIGVKPDDPNAHRRGQDYGNKNSNYKNFW